MQTLAWYTPFIQGLTVSWTSTTSLTIKAGSCISDDAPGYGNQLMQLDSDTVLNCALSGINGVQGGSLSANTLYDVYLVKSTNENTVGVYAAANAESLYLPFNYNAKFRIFSFYTDGSSHIRDGSQTGQGFDRTWTYDVPVSFLTAGTSTTYATINLATYLPVIARKMWVYIKGSFTPSAAGDLATFATGGSVATAGQAFITGEVAASAMVQTVALPTSTINAIQYKVAASGSLNASLAGYVDQLISV